MTWPLYNANFKKEDLVSAAEKKTDLQAQLKQHLL